MGLKWKAFIASLESGGKIQLRVEGKFLHRKKINELWQLSENFISSMNHIYIDTNNYNVNKAVRVM